MKNIDKKIDHNKVVKLDNCMLCDELFVKEFNSTEAFCEKCNKFWEE